MSFEIPEPRSSKVASLSDAITAHVRPGDAIHLGMTQSRYSAAWDELVRRFAGSDPGFELHAVQMTSPMAALVHTGLARRIVTSWAGNSYWTPGPNQIYQRAWSDGVTFEHWSILTYAQRLWAGARGLAHTTTRSLRGSSMMANPGVSETVDGDVLIPALNADVSLIHAPVADAQGNALFSPPLFEGVWGALAARRGCILTVDRIVPTEEIRARAHLPGLPGSRVLAVVEVPMGAHPGGLIPAGLDDLVTGYGEDYEQWVAARDAAAAGAMDEWVKTWIAGPSTRSEYLARLGDERIAALHDRATGAAPDPTIDAEAPATATERAIIAAADVLAERITAEHLTAVLAGAGNANLAAWLAGYRVARDRGTLDLIAEMGLVGYWPRAGEPILFNPRNFPTCTMLADIDTTLAVLIGGMGARSIGALGAAQVDRRGNINSTEVPGSHLLMGSGGANDVITCAGESVVLAAQSPSRFLEQVPYVTGPGDRVSVLVSDLGIYRKAEGELVLTAVFDEDGVERARSRCGWDLRVAGEVARIDAPARADLTMLRAMDPQGWFRQ